MPGLLSDVLPYLYSQGDRAKRVLGGLLADPIGTLQQTAGSIVDAGNAQQGLLAQAFANPQRPFQVTDKQALGGAIDNTFQNVMGFAPAGITVYHGSPHTFDAFDASKIGTGEGAQAYGHGLYLAENPSTAKSYATAGIDRNDPMYVSQARMAATDPMWGSTAAEKEQRIRVIAGDKAADYLRDNFDKLTTQAGNHYKVDLPDSAVEKMLDWDKPLIQQAPEVQAAIRKIRPNIDSYGQVMGGRLQPAMNQTGEDFINALGPNHAYQLPDAGIPGIRYLDGGSRGNGAGTSNFVVFPGQESLLQILERNGVPLK